VTKLQGVLREKQDVLERRRTQPLPDASQNTNPNNLARPDEIRSKALSLRRWSSIRRIV